MPRLDFLRRLVVSQQHLGPFLRFEFLVPLTFLVFVLGGKYLTLPPGPLCDEGMVLFMEGGCDWGNSNIFFFAKVSLLVATNLAMVISWLRPPIRWRGFSVHLALLGLMAWALRSGGNCDTYYSHPNGSLGQMILEMACFAIFGIALARVSVTASWLARLAAIVAWNAFHVGMFYLFLNLFDHWTWQHSALLGGAMLMVAAPLILVGPASVWPRVAEFRAAGIRAATSRRGAGIAGGREALTTRQVLLLFFMLAIFAIAANPFGLGPMAILCGAIGLATAWLAGRFAGPRTSRAVAVLVALAIPAHGLIRGAEDYREQRHYADQLLVGDRSLTVADAEVLEAAAIASRRQDGTFERVDLVERHAEVGEIARRVLSAEAELRYGTTLSLLVPLAGESHGRFYRSWNGGPHGDVIELVTEHSYLEGYELVHQLQETGRRRAVSWWSYVADTALRWKPPRFYSGSTLVDRGGEVRAVLVAGTLPLRVVELEDASDLVR